RSRFITSTGCAIWGRRRHSRCEVWTPARAQGGPRRSTIGWPGSTGRCRLPCCRWRSRRSLLSLRGLLAALRRLGAELLREPLDAALRIDQLLAAREQPMAVRADFEVPLGLGRSRLPRGAARAPRLDDVILGVD